MSNKKGFTLIEIIVVLVIIGILAVSGSSQLFYHDTAGSCQGCSK